MMFSQLERIEEFRHDKVSEAVLLGKPGARIAQRRDQSLSWGLRALRINLRVIIRTYVLRTYGVYVGVLRRTRLNIDSPGTEYRYSNTVSGDGWGPTQSLDSSLYGGVRPCARAIRTPVPLSGRIVPPEMSSGATVDSVVLLVPLLR